MGSKWTVTVRQLRRRLAREPSACASKDGTFITFISRSALGLRFERRDARLLPALHERMGLRRGVDSGHPIGVALSKIISATSCWPSPTRDCQNTCGQSFTRRSSIAFQLQKGDEDSPRLIFSNLQAHRTCSQKSPRYENTRSNGKADLVALHRSNAH